MKTIEHLKSMKDERFLHIYEALGQDGFGPLDGEVDVQFQQILVDYMGWENYDLRIDEVQAADVTAGEPLLIDREVLADIRAVFSEGRYK